MWAEGVHVDAHSGGFSVLSSPQPTGIVQLPLPFFTADSPRWAWFRHTLPSRAARRTPTTESS